MTVPENVDGQEEARMRDAVPRIRASGVPPEGCEDAGFPGEEGGPSDEILDLWESYQDVVVSITRPVTWEEAEILIRCCPTDHMAGIEWTVLHGIESVFTPERLEEFRSLVERCNSELMKGMLLERLQNYINSRE